MYFLDAKDPDKSFSISAVCKSDVDEEDGLIHELIDSRGLQNSFAAELVSGAVD